MKSDSPKSSSLPSHTQSEFAPGRVSLLIALVSALGSLSPTTQAMTLTDARLQQLINAPSALRANPCSDPFNPGVLNMQTDFGAVGNGVMDDLAAMQASADMLAVISKKKPVTKTVVLVYPEGNYRIDKIWDHSSNRRPLLMYDGLINIRIHGCNATVQTKADFHMTMDELSSPPYYITHRTAITPFLFRNSSNFSLSGFTLRGNANLTTREPNTTDRILAEPFNAGVITINCHHYTLQNLDVGYFATDGLALGDADGFGNSLPATPDHDFKVTKVSSHHNGRNALSVFQARRAQFTDVELSFSGDTGGQLSWAPKLGVDIEPDYLVGQLGFNEKTGDLVFSRINVHDNIGGAFYAINSHQIENVTIKDSKIVHTSSSPYAVAFSIRNALMSNTFLDLNTGALFAQWIAPPPPPEHPANTTLRNITLKTTGTGLVVDGTVAHVLIENSRFIGSQPPDFGSYFPWLRSSKVILRNSSFSYPKAWPNTESYAQHGAILGIVEVKCSANNKFATGYTDATHPTYVQYGQSTDIQLDTYLSFPRLKGNYCHNERICTRPVQTGCGG